MPVPVLRSNYPSCHTLRLLASLEWVLESVLTDELLPSTMEICPMSFWGGWL